MTMLTPHTDNTAKTTNKFLEREGVNTMLWTTISPDMNPIEHVWAHVKQKMRKREHYHKADDFFETLILVWNQITPEFILSLSTSMRRRLNALRDANGEHGQN